MATRSSGTSKTAKSTKKAPAKGTEGAFEVPVARGGRAAVRSEDRPTAPYYAKGDGGKAQTTDELLAAAGLVRSRPLSPDEIQGLLKAPADLLLFADNIVSLYGREAAELGLRDLDGKTLASLYDRAAHIAPRAAALEEAAELARQQALVAQSDLLDSLLRIRRRVQALGEEDRELLRRWEPVLAALNRQFAGRTSRDAKKPDDSSGPTSPTP